MKKYLILAVLSVIAVNPARAGEIENASFQARQFGQWAPPVVPVPAPATAPSPYQLSPGETARIGRIVRVASQVLTDRQSGYEPIPDEILKAARCVAAVRIGQGGFLIGGGGGEGMVSCRLASGRWSAPSFLTFSQVSAGLQIGGSMTDLVLVFMARTARQIMEQAQFNLGLDSGLVVGPVGQHVSGGVTYEANTLMYGRSAGLGANLVSLSGTLITHMPARNAKVYSALGLSQGRDVLALDAYNTPQIAMPYPATVYQYAPAPKP